VLVVLDMFDVLDVSVASDVLVVLDVLPSDFPTDAPIMPVSPAQPPP
jgi:hypothetical protein